MCRGETLVAAPSAPSWPKLMGSCLLAVVAGFLSFFAAAFLVSVPALLVVAATSVALLVGYGGARRAGWSARGSVGAAVVTLSLLGWAFSGTILAPWPSSAAAKLPPPTPTGVQYWKLSTGSRIAYLKVPAQGTDAGAPIIIVGGGPGEEDVADHAEVAFFSQLTTLGHDVYFYDQVGSGLSARLANPDEYTLTRAVADLEAIRAQIGATRVILMGSSWGGTLVANYMAAHPQRVAMAVFTSPAPIDYAQWSSSDDDILSVLPPAVRKQADGILIGSPRFLSWYVLGEINAAAAHALVSDASADAAFNTFLQLVQRGTVCKAAHLPTQPEQGNGFYDNVFTTRSAEKGTPADNPQRALASDHTPVLVMTGACNYVKWPVEWQYRTTFPNSTLLYFPQAGHEIYLDQPKLYLASIEAFITGARLPLRPWTSATPPPDLGR